MGLAWRPANFAPAGGRRDAGPFSRQLSPELAVTRTSSRHNDDFAHALKEASGALGGTGRKEGRGKAEYGSAGPGPRGTLRHGEANREDLERTQARHVDDEVLRVAASKRRRSHEGELLEGTLEQLQQCVVSSARPARAEMRPRGQGK